MSAAGKGAGRKGEGRGAGGGAVARRQEDATTTNRDRLTYFLLSLVGRQLSVRVRGDITYAGSLHSCDLNNDQSITLKHARKLGAEGAAEDPEAAEIPHLIIAGKDWLHVSADDIAPLGDEQPKGKFAIDSDIAKSSGKSEGRELVPWSDDSVPDVTGSLGTAGDMKGFDQFETARRMTGRSGGEIESYNVMEQYTTKLDVSKIDPSKRQEAERIAREIEAGNQHASVEERLNDDGDEEAAFGASQPSAKAAPAPLPRLPGDNGQDDARLGGELRGPRRGMISEMKRINALNLEPTAPKLDDPRRSYKDGPAGSRSRQSPGGDSAKEEFQQALAMIKEQEANKKAKAGGVAPGGGDVGKAMTKASSLNPQAKAFSMNPDAGAFTPSGSAVANRASPAGAHQQVSLVNFPPPSKKSIEWSSKNMKELLEPFFQKANQETSSLSSFRSEWPNSKGPPYNQVLGQPRAGAPAQMGPGGPCGAGWPVAAPMARPQAPPAQQGQGQSGGGAAGAAGAQQGGNDWRSKGNNQQAQPMMQPNAAGGYQVPGYQMYQQTGPAQGCGGCNPQPGQQGGCQVQQQPQQQMPQQQQQQQQQNMQQQPGQQPMQPGQQQMMMGGQQQGQVMMMGCPQQPGQMMFVAPQGGGQCGMNMGPMAKFPGPCGQQQMMVMPAGGMQGMQMQGVQGMQGAQGMQGDQQQMMYVMMAPGQGGCVPMQQGCMPMGGCSQMPAQGQGNQS